MHLKKLVRLASAALFILSVCACTNSDSSKNNDEQLPELIIACDIYEPYTFFDDEGNFSGIDVELADEACRRIGYKAKFERIKWEEKEKLLSAGDIDCIWSCFSMDDREDKYSWIGPYMYSSQSVVVRATGDIKSLGDLEGKKFAVQTSTKAEEFLLKRPYDTIPNADKIYSFSEIGETFGALSKGYVDACAGHDEAMRNFIKDSPGSYRIIDELLAQSRLGIAFRKDENREFLETLANALTDMRNEGIVAQIAEKYNVSAENAAEVRVIGGK